jgi:hypothetical protein
MSSLFFLRADRDQRAMHAAASDALPQQRPAVLRALPAIREYLPRESNPKIAGARRVD